MPLLPIPTYLQDNDGGVWLFAASIDGDPQTTGPITSPVSSVTSVLLNDVLDGSTYSLYVLPSPSDPLHSPAGEFRWTPVSQTSAPTQLFVSNPAGAVYAAMIVGGDLKFVPASYGLANYYLNLFTSEYQNSTNLLSWAAVLLRPFIDAAIAVGTLAAAFDVDRAGGVQLDTIGLILGASRTVGFQPSGGVSPVLDDSTYRIYLKAKIVQNQWDGQIGSLYAAWQGLFPGGTITIIDNQNMTATIILSGTFNSITQDLITNGYIVPRPEAVLYNYTFADLPILGFDQDNTFVAGFDVGHFA